MIDLHGTGAGEAFCMLLLVVYMLLKEKCSPAGTDERNENTSISKYNIGWRDRQKW